MLPRFGVLWGMQWERPQEWFSIECSVTHEEQTISEECRISVK